jgi:DHA1 family inner membrane transport protein
LRDDFNEESVVKGLFLPLLASGFTVSSTNIVTSLLLIEIGTSFGVSVGIAGHIRTLSYIVAIVSSLLLGALSIRFDHKKLLLIGLFSSTLSALGSGFSLNFGMMFLSYSLNGVGMAMVLPMVFSLIAEYFSEEKRPSVIGLFITSQGFSNVIGSPIVGYISENWGWRLTFLRGGGGRRALGYIFPVALLSLVLTIRMIPSTSSTGGDTLRVSVFSGFREVFSNRSAVACLIGFTFSTMAFQALVTYGASFYRQRFLLSMGYATLFYIAAPLFFMSGSFFGGRLVNRVGRKTLTVASALIAGVFTVFFSNVPFMAVSMVLAMAVALFNGVRNVAANNLTLEQLPKLRGLMMSLFSAADNLGMAFGSGIGGYTLFLYGYGALGISLGAMGIISALLFHFLTRDPIMTPRDVSSMR